jgi:lipid A oxidase
MQRGALVLGIVVALLLAAMAWPAPARAEMQIGAYGGVLFTPDSDVDLTQPNGTNMSLSSVPWDGKPFADPPYYGFRATWWTDRVPAWGIMLDYTHAKTYSDLGATVATSGTRGGAPVGANETVGTTFSTLEFTDGLNLLTLNGLRRWEVGRDFRPYAGLGLGLAIPHVEVTTGFGPRTFEYQLTGVAAQGVLGLEARMTEAVSLFGEYKLSYAQVNADLVNGGTLKTNLWTNHFILGLSVNF